MGEKFQKSLAADRRRRADEAGAEVEALVKADPPLIQEVWYRLFRNITVQDPRHNSDHYMVLGCLPSAPLTETKRYLGGRKRWPVRPPVKPTRTDELFAALQIAVPKEKPR